VEKGNLGEVVLRKRARKANKVWLPLVSLFPDCCQARAQAARHDDDDESEEDDDDDEVDEAEVEEKPGLITVFACECRVDSDGSGAKA
jgi:hypothetical protein